MLRKVISTLALVTFSSGLYAADVSLANLLNGVQSGTVQLDPANTYVGNVYLGTDRGSIVIEGNGATIRMDPGNFINADGMFLSVRNVTVTGSNGSFFLASRNGDRESILTLDDVKLEGVGRDAGQNGVFAENAKLVINRLWAINLSYGLSLNNVNVEVGEDCIFDDNKNGILMTNNSTLTTPSVNPQKPLLFRRNTDNAFLLQNSTALLNACEFYDNGATGHSLIAQNANLTLAQNSRFSNNTTGLVISGGICDVYQTHFANNGFRDLRLENVTGDVHDCTFLGSDIGIDVINGANVDIFDCLLVDNFRRGINAFRSDPGEAMPRLKVRNCEIRVSLSRQDTEWDAGINLIDTQEATLEFNVIEGWRTAIQTSGSTATIRDNTLRLSRQPDGFGDRGQGIAAILGSNIIATNNFIHDTQGDNIFVSSGSSALIQQNLLVASRENAILGEEVQGLGRVSIQAFDNDIRFPTVGIAMVGDTEGHIAGNTIRVPFEDREFADPSRGVLLEETVGFVRVENNIIFDAPLTGIFVEKTNNHTIQGNVVLRSGLFGYESTQSSGNQVVGNIIADSWETGALILNGSGHQFTRNAIVSNFRRQLSDNGTGLFYNVTFGNGTSGILIQNSFESILSRKGGIESVDASSVIAFDNWWGSPSGPSFSLDQQTGAASVVVGPNLTVEPHLTEVPVKYRYWYKDPITANVPKSFHDFDNTGVGLTIETHQNVGDNVVAFMDTIVNPMSESPTVSNARYMQIYVSHEIRAQIKNRRFQLLLPKTAYSGTAQYFDVRDRVWKALPVAPANQGDNFVLNVNVDLIKNTVFALGSGAPGAVMNELVGIPQENKALDRNNDFILDAADLMFE